VSAPPCLARRLAQPFAIPHARFRGGA
jgi:hypothetical protein